jgi:hypothetical protein
MGSIKSTDPASPLNIMSTIPAVEDPTAQTNRDGVEYVQCKRLRAIRPRIAMLQIGQMRNLKADGDPTTERATSVSRANAKEPSRRMRNPAVVQEHASLWSMTWGPQDDEPVLSNPPGGIAWSSASIIGKTPLATSSISQARTRSGPSEKTIAVSQHTVTSEIGFRFFVIQS